MPWSRGAALSFLVESHVVQGRTFGFFSNLMMSKCRTSFLFVESRGIPRPHFRFLVESHSTQWPHFRFLVVSHGVQGPHFRFFAESHGIQRQHTHHDYLSSGPSMEQRHTHTKLCYHRLLLQSICIFFISLFLSLFPFSSSASMHYSVVFLSVFLLAARCSAESPKGDSEKSDSQYTQRRFICKAPHHHTML